MSGQIKGNEAVNVPSTHDVTTTPNDNKVGLDVHIIKDSSLDGSPAPVSAGNIITEEFDSVAVTAKNSDGCPTTVEYSLAGDLIATLTITYDVDGDLQSVTRT